MKTVYLDPDFRCFLSDPGGLTPVETEAFDGKCDTFVEGFRLVPAGKSWTREDGTVFTGEMAAPWRDYSLLLEFQAQYEKTQAELLDMRSALDTIYQGVTA